MTRPGLARRAAAAGVVATLALGVAGCGNEGNGSGSVDAQSQVADGLTRDDFVQSVYDASIDAGSAHVALETTGGMATEADGDISYAGGSPSMQMTMTPQLGAGPSEIRLVDGTLYLQIPGITPEGKFHAIDPKSMGAAGAFRGMTDQLDPLKSIRAMGSALEKVELVGQEKVDGTSTDHYLVTVDLAEMLAKTKAPTQGLSGLPKTVTYDMWLDEGDRPRKMAFEIAGTSLEMELSEWGEPVDIEKPAAADITRQPLRLAG